MLDKNTNDYEAMHELIDLIGFYPDHIKELGEGGYYLDKGKFALAEQTLLRCIDRLEKAENQLRYPESLLNRMKTTNFNDQNVFWHVSGEIEISLRTARGHLAIAQNKLANGIQEEPSEERFKELLIEKKNE